MTDTVPLYLVELVAYDPSRGAELTLRYATGQGFTTGTSDTQADTYFEPRIRQAVDVVRDMFTTGATFGRSRVGYGDLVLLNGDGALDSLLALSLDGRRVTIWQSTVLYPTRMSDFTVALIGTMEQPEFTGDRVTIRLRDRQAELDIPLQTTKYAGDNALPNGLEGVANDLKGKPKPICYGNPKNVPAPCVNTSKLIYQVNDGAVNSVDAVYDRGVSLTAGGTYASQADLLDNSLAPAAGAYKYYAAGGYFRLGSSPAGLVTADVTQGASAAERTAAQIFSQLLTQAAKANVFGKLQTNSTRATDDGSTRVTDTGATRVAQADWMNADLAALDAANSSVLGFWTDQETTVSEVIDKVAASVGAWWGVDRTGVYRMKQFVAPTGAGRLVFAANDLKKPLQRLAATDETHGVPVYRVTLNWGRNYAPQTTDLAASVTDARRAYLAEDWRQAVSTDTTVQAVHLLAPDLTEDTLLTAEADAAAEAARRLNLRKVRRDRFELVVALDADTSALELGDVIEIVHARYGLSIIGSESGKPFVVIGVQPNADKRELTLNVWGSSSGLDNLITDTGSYRVTDTGAYRVSQAA